MTDAKFPNPFEVKAVSGTQGWERMYPYYHLFSSERRQYEENRFWFFDAMHHPEPMYPFDTITAEAWWVALSQNTSRIFAIPPALGIAHRIVNGYVYISAHGVEDPQQIAERAAYFEKRAGYYFEHWDELYAKWEIKFRGVIGELKSIEVPRLPAYEPEEVVTEGRGISSGYRLLAAYEQVILNMYQAWQYHFEMLNLSYLAYLTFFDFCKQAFPDINPQTIAKMVAGADVILFRPEEELGRLAELAIELQLGELLTSDVAPEELFAKLRQSESGGKWLQAFETAKDPWFYLSSGTGMAHTHTSWIDDLRIPLAHLRTYVRRLQKGEDIKRPLAKIAAERDRLVAEYQALLPSDEQRAEFQQRYALVRRTYPYAENHMFFVEHWHHTIFWNKIREFGQLLVDHGFFQDKEDIFYFHRFEIPAMLYDVVTAWAVGPGVPAQGPYVWPKEVARRREVMERFRQWTPPPALGPTPDSITEPFTIMLWGITSERVKAWLTPPAGPTETPELRGLPAAPGVVQGPARVITNLKDLDTLQEGEILVCPITTPSWVPIFSKIKAAVTDVGGMTSHAAIVAREYDLPTVVGTGMATTLIKTGDLLWVDADHGVVRILARASAPSAPAATKVS